MKFTCLFVYDWKLTPVDDGLDNPIISDFFRSQVYSEHVPGGLLFAEFFMLLFKQFWVFKLLTETVMSVTNFYIKTHKHHFSKL